MARPLLARSNRFQLFKGGSSSGGSGAGGGESGEAAGGSTEAKVQGSGSHSDNAMSPGQYAEATGVSFGEAQARFDAVDAFTGAAYDSIRRNQRNGIPDERADLIEKYIASMPAYPRTIYRGMSFDNAKQRDSFLRSISGGTMELNAMSSFSSARGAAKDFSDNNGVIFKVKGNRSAVSIRSLSRFENEMEVLAPKGARYTVGRISRLNDGRVEVTLREE